MDSLIVLLVFSIPFAISIGVILWRLMVNTGQIVYTLSFDQMSAKELLKVIGFFITGHILWVLDVFYIVYVIQEIYHGFI